MELVSYPPTGISWVKTFLKCHSKLETILSHVIEASRITTITKAAMQKFFDDYQDVLAEEGIKEEHIYNMDETGFFLNIKTDCRLCNWRYTTILCGCRQVFAEKNLKYHQVNKSGLQY